jgi:Glyoxalase-like domain
VRRTPWCRANDPAYARSVTRLRWTTVVLDCSDPSSLARFWSSLLGGEPSRINDNFYVVKSGSTWLAAQRIDGFQPPTWPDGDRPKQMHLDLAVDDLPAAVREALHLGATQEEEQPSPQHWRVMRDPAGHLFCLSDHIQDYLPIDLNT